MKSTSRSKKGKQNRTNIQTEKQKVECQANHQMGEEQQDPHGKGGQKTKIEGKSTREQELLY